MIPSSRVGAIAGKHRLYYAFENCITGLESGHWHAQHAGGKG
jgi:hypothetical protein